VHPILVKLLSTAAVYVGAILIEALVIEISKVSDSLDRDVHGEHVFDDEFDEEQSPHLHVVHQGPGIEAGSRLVAEMKNFAEGNRIMPFLLKSLTNNNSN